MTIRKHMARIEKQIRASHPRIQAGCRHCKLCRSGTNLLILLPFCWPKTEDSPGQRPDIRQPGAQPHKR